MTNTSILPSVRPTFSSPGDVAYDHAVQTFNLAVRHTPLATVIAESTCDVVDAVDLARELQLRVRVHATGHAAATGAAVTGSLLVRTALAQPVRVDPLQRTARIAAGTRWGAVVEAAAVHGLVALHGSSPTVGAIGYLLRGGLSFYGRRFGLAANSIRSITIVLANGDVVRTSSTTEPDLFWALRGGGGGFGIVTEVEIDLFAMFKVITGAVFFDAKQAEIIAPLWRTWTENAPRSATTSLRLMNLPPLPGVPPMLTQGQVLAIDGAFSVERPMDLEPATLQAADLLGPLRAAATPLLDTWRVAEPRELQMTHMDPQDPLPVRGDHALLHDLGDEGLARFVSAASRESGSALAAVELRQLGAAFASPEETAGALDRLDAAFAYVGLGVLAPPASAESVAADLSRMAAATRPWHTGFTTPTFVEDYHQAQRTFDDATVARVAAIRAEVDPDGLFSGDVSPVRDAVAAHGS
jgi:hypothetical protein